MYIIEIERETIKRFNIWKDAVGLSSCAGLNMSDGHMQMVMRCYVKFFRLYKVENLVATKWKWSKALIYAVTYSHLTKFYDCAYNFQSAICICVSVLSFFLICIIDNCSNILVQSYLCFQNHSSVFKYKANIIFMDTSLTGSLYKTLSDDREARGVICKISASHWIT